MNKPFVARVRPRRRAPIDAMLERLQPALDGYPVKELVGLWADAHDPSAAAFGALLDQCISAWIAGLDSDAAAFTPEDDDDRFSDAHRARVVCARAALLLVRERIRRQADPGHVAPVHFRADRHQDRVRSNAGDA